MDKKQILKKLRNDEDYYGDFGKQFLSNSDISVLLKNPKKPETFQLHKNGKNFPPNYLHKSWIDHLYWDVELEP